MQRTITSRNMRAAEIFQICRVAGEPIFVSEDGQDDMVVMSKDTYVTGLAKLDVYSKLAAAEEQFANGHYVSADTVFQDLREKRERRYV